MQLCINIINMVWLILGEENLYREKPLCYVIYYKGVCIIYMVIIQLNFIIISYDILMVY